ncbi:RNase P subunit p30-domain-containing protein [Microdochium bolleyi]|uniref:RNase P subunit p30-domain-containing protein n=1 Tax=Microdochium bolleyi TaxID=196109 RepID=A0A136J1V9_9PEZI|nr:RNase P subunit p30-domain-containing protein [Microdochium bolleyi]
MLYDLNIAWSPTATAAELDRTLAFSASLGYDVVALNHIINPPIPAQTVNPLPRLLPPSATDATSKTSATQPNGSATEQPAVLHRVTVVMSDPSQTHRLVQLAAAYDILAIRPLTDKAFQNACLNMAEPSLISLDMTQHLPFHFRPKPCMAAINRGLRFEVCYSQMLTADARGRASFIGNVVELVRATRGRGIVLSSEAKNAMGLRGPADVVNLLAVWGLGTEKGNEGLGSIPRGVVVNERVKRTGFRGVIDIVQVAQVPEERKQQGDGAEDTENETKQAKGTSNGQERKRKPEEKEARSEQPMSKRQAKKLKAAGKKTAA